MRSLQALTRSSDTRRATFAQPPTLGSHSQPECNKGHLRVCPSFSARSCLSQMVVKAWKGNFHPQFGYSKRSLWFVLLASPAISASRTVKTMNKVFILSTTNGLVHSVNYGPFEVSPRFPFYLQKVALSWVSQFSVFPLLSAQ